MARAWIGMGVAVVAAAGLGLGAGMLLSRGGPAGDDKARIEGVVRDYLLAKPEVLMEALAVLEQRAKAEEDARGAKAVEMLWDRIYDQPGDPVGGNARGAVTLVEFVDYRCGYCKRVHETVRGLVEANPDLRFVTKEFPILGPQSVFAARAALAARAQDRYQAFSDALMSARGELDERRVMGIARATGLDADRLAADMQAGRAEAEALLRANMELARALGISGTPAFIIGTQVIRGAVDGDTLKAAVEAARPVFARRKSEAG